ncbi:hypothetical protein [Frankia sp. R82]|uniref:hypothetical protein n=1 Tax=Frankia sp. R82 TaxID=2950553 RepID=UPI00204325AC|nr:hypothetical protein [Frankia sp. R82]MCM3886653.1 hypothetical protein [Frankia sp. R82]
MTTFSPVCGDVLVLTEAELAELAAIPDPDTELESELPCELEAGHPGPHLAQAQASRDLEWWMLWQHARRDLMILEPCPAETTDGDTVCNLPIDHPGRHSFDLTDIGGRTPAPHHQQKILELARRRTGPTG